MKAGIASDSGIRIAEVDKPQPGQGQILVEVKAAGLNRADLKAAQGSGIATRESLGKPIGMEWAGVVTEAGEGAKGFAPGDRVMCSGSGGYGEYAVCDITRALTIPDELGFEQAAVLPLALLTMHDAIATNGRLKRGETVLIHGASSGVGLMGLQIARYLGAGMVIGTSTSEKRRLKLKGFGAQMVVDTTKPGWSDLVLEATGGKGVDLIIDMVSGPAIEECMKSASVLGRIVNVGRLGGVRTEFDFDLHALKRLEYIGVTFRTRSPGEIAAIVQKMQADLWEGVSSGELHLPIDSEFGLDDAGQAHARMQSNQHFGKILLHM